MVGQLSAHRLVRDLEASGYSTTYEIGSLGLYTPSYSKSPKVIYSGMLLEIPFSLLFKNLARRAISFSYSIYISQDQSDWNLNKETALLCCTNTYSGVLRTGSRKYFNLIGICTCTIDFNISKETVCRLHNLIVH